MNQKSRAVALSEEGREITPDLLPEPIGVSLRVETKAYKGHLKARVAVFKKQMIQDVIEKHAGNITQATEELGLTRDGLIKKMARLKMR